MGTVLKVTKLPQFDSVVIKQSGGRFFIAAPDSLIIDKAGLLELIEVMVKMDFISIEEIKDTVFCGCENPFLPIGGRGCENCGKEVL